MDHLNEVYDQSYQCDYAPDLALGLNCRIYLEKGHLTPDADFFQSNEKVHEFFVTKT